MFVNPIDDINNQIDQIEWNFGELKTWNPLKDSQTYLCAVFVAALGLLLTNGCAHEKTATDSTKVENHDYPRRY